MSDTPVMPPLRGSLSVDDLAEALNRLVRKGVTREEVANRLGQDVLPRLQCVQGSEGQDHVLDVARNFIRVLESACRRVEPKSRADAARALFGLYQEKEPRETEPQSAKDREERAAELMTTSYANFHRFLRRALIISVAHEIDRQEFRHIQVQQRAGHQALVYPQGYAVISAASSYTISEDDYRLHFYRRTIEITAVKPNVTQYVHYYYWTGRGQEGPPEILSSGHRLIGGPIPIGGWQYCDIHLGRQLEVAERVTIELKHRFYDEAQCAKTHFSQGVPNEGMEQITLEVKLPLSRLPSKVEYITYVDSAPSKVPLDNVPGTCDSATGLIQWKPEEIIYPRRYAISWDYPNGSLYP